MIRRRITLLSFVLLLFTSCEKSYLRVNVLHPAEVQIGPIRKLAVDEFVVIERARESNTSRERRPLTFGTVVTDILLGILGLDDARDDVAAHRSFNMTGRLVDALLKNGHFTVLSPEAADLEGTLTGAGAYAVKEDGAWENRTRKDRDGHETAYRVYSISRRIDLEITYRVRDARGRFLATKTIDASKSDAAEGDDERSARSHLDSTDEMVNALVNEMLATLVIQIAPHYELERMELEPGSSGRMKTAMEFARQLKWPEATRIWEEVLADPSASSDHLSATYNMGVASEVTGELDDAWRLFNDCRTRSRNTRYKQALDRIAMRLEEARRLNAQGR